MGGVRFNPGCSSTSASPNDAKFFCVLGWMGKTTGAEAQRFWRRSTMNWHPSRLSTVAGLCMVSRWKSSPAPKPRSERMGLRSIWGEKCTKVSIMVLPTKCTLLPWSRPSSFRWVMPESSVTKWCALSWSTKMRLISSGMERSKLRRPASRWPNGIPSRWAASAPASVLFTSPGTNTKSGLTFSMTSTSWVVMWANCNPAEPECNFRT